MKRKIKSAQLHDVMFIADIGEIKKTMDEQSHRGISMLLVDGGVDVQLKGIEFFIPLTNFKNLVLVKDEPKV